MELDIERGTRAAEATRAAFGAIKTDVALSSKGASDLIDRMKEYRRETTAVLPGIDSMAEHLEAIIKLATEGEKNRHEVVSSLDSIRRLSDQIHEEERLLVEQDYVILAKLEKALSVCRTL